MNIEREAMYEELSEGTEQQIMQSIKLLGHSIETSLPAKKRRKKEQFVEEDVQALQKGAEKIQRFLFRKLDKLLDRFEKRMDKLITVPEDIDISLEPVKTNAKKEFKELENSIASISEDHRKIDHEIIKAVQRYLKLKQESVALDVCISKCATLTPSVTCSHETVKEITRLHETVYPALQFAEQEYAQVVKDLFRLVPPVSKEKENISVHSTEILRQASLLLESS